MTSALNMNGQYEKLQMLIAEQAAEWYVAQRDGGLDEARRREFMRWLRSSPAHVAEYLGIAGLAHDMADAARESDIPLAQLLAEAGVDKVVSLDGDVIEPPPAHSGRLKPTLQGRTRKADRGADRRADFSPPAKQRAGVGAFGLRNAAVAMTLLLVAGAALWFAAMPGQYVTGHGEQRTWQLADNTVVRLNSNSALDVDFDDERRLVTVKRGQVYFEIAGGDARPFNVLAGSHLIEDIGTAFDVYRQEDAVTVTVVEGRVRIWDRKAPPASARIQSAAGRDRAAPPPAPVADLEAGTQLRLASTGPVAMPARVDVQRATAWVREKIVFDQDPIAAVAAEFNRYNHQQIRIDDPYVGAIPISGVFRTYDVQSFVQFLNRLPGVRAEQTEDHIVVTAEPATRSRSG